MDILVNCILMFFLLIQHFLEFLDLLFCDNPLWHVSLLLSCTSPYVRVLPYTCKIKEGISNALFPDFFFTFRYLHLFSSFLLHPAVQQQFKYRHLCCELVPHLSCLDIRICLLTDAYAGKQLLLRK